MITYVVMKTQDHGGWCGVGGRKGGREPCSSTVVIMLEVLLKLTMFILKECSIASTTSGETSKHDGNHDKYLSHDSP